MANGSATTVRLPRSVGRKGSPRYAPQIEHELLHQLWETKERTGIPISKLVNQAIRKFLAEVKNAV